MSARTGCHRLALSIGLLSILTVVHSAAASSVSHRTWGCDQWHPTPIVIDGYGTAARICSSPQGRSVVIANISSGVVRVYPKGNTHLQVRADNSIQASLVESALGGACPEGTYCDLRPGRRLLATDPNRVTASIDIPAAESFEASVAAKLSAAVAAMATPRPERFKNAIAACISDLTGTFESGTQEEQVAAAIQFAPQCKSTLQEIKQAARGDEAVTSLLKPGAIAKSVMRDTWLEVVAFDAARALRLIR